MQTKQIFLRMMLIFTSNKRTLEVAVGPLDVPAHPKMTMAIERILKIHTRNLRDSRRKPRVKAHLQQDRMTLTQHVRDSL